MNYLQGWEEVTDTAVTHLLKTCLSKSVKDQTGKLIIIMIIIIMIIIIMIIHSVF